MLPRASGRFYGILKYRAIPKRADFRTRPPLETPETTRPPRPRPRFDRISRTSGRTRAIKEGRMVRCRRFLSGGNAGEAIRNPLRHRIQRLQAGNTPPDSTACPPPIPSKPGPPPWPPFTSATVALFSLLRSSMFGVRCWMFLSRPPLRHGLPTPRPAGVGTNKPLRTLKSKD